jgi:hypothetical protein
MIYPPSRLEGLSTRKAISTQYASPPEFKSAKSFQSESLFSLIGKRTSNQVLVNNLAGSGSLKRKPPVNSHEFAHAYGLKSCVTQALTEA